MAFTTKPDALAGTFAVMAVGWLVVMNVLQLRLMADALRVHPVVVLGSVLGGSKVAGIGGAVFGIPIAAVIAAFVFHRLERTRDTGPVAARATRRLQEREGRPVRLARASRRRAWTRTSLKMADDICALPGGAAQRSGTRSGTRHADVLTSRGARLRPPLLASTPAPMIQPPDWLLRLHSADGLFVSDGRQRIVAWNAAAERLLGFPASEVLGRACFDVLAGHEPGGHPVCRRDCRVATNARQGRGTPEYDIVARDREGAPVQLTVTIVLAGADGTGSPYLVHLVRPRARAGTVAKADPARLGKTLDPASIPPLGQPLSRREFEVVALIAAGRSTAEIGAELSISRFTARNHIANAQHKLGAHSRVEAVVYAAHHRLI